MGFPNSAALPISTILLISILASLFATSMATKKEDMMMNNNYNMKRGWGGYWGFGRRHPTWPGYNSTNCPFSSHKNTSRTHAHTPTPTTPTPSTPTPTPPSPTLPTPTPDTPLPTPTPDTPPPTPTPTTRGPNKIIVGGSNNWNFGFNYSDWAFKNGPFYLNDILVFKYAAPVNGSPGHSVYLLPDFWSYLKCDLTRAKQVATPTQGGGEGFEFKLNSWRPHYFACGEHNGIHCNLGMMKFFVMPIFRYWG